MKYSVLIFIFLFSLNSWATIGFEDGIFPELATSSRALAMGNAFLCKADDASAAFYNPAGLGTVRFTHLHISNFSLESNKDLIGDATAGSISNAASGFSKIFTSDGMRQLMLANPGDLAHSRLQVLPNFTTRYFSLGYLLAKRTRATVTSTTSTTGFEYADRLDMGPYAALNFSLFGGIFKAGASVVLLNRKEINTDLNANSTLNLSDSAYSRGNASIMTGGVRITLPITMLPTFSANMHNALNKNFSASSGYAGAPTTIKRSIDVGMSVTPQIGTSTRLHLEANYKDITGEYSSVSSTRKMLVGMELDFSRTFYFRLGYGDGFGSAGIGLRSQKLEFDLTTYAVDTTASTFRGAEDRRFVIGISSGF